MLTADHIKVLRLDRARMEAHSKLPPPKYSMKLMTDQLAAISDATVSTVLQLDMQQFTEQLPRARALGASYVFNTLGGQVIGISAATSLIKCGAVLRKHLILPEYALRSSDQLDRHFIIGVFIRHLVVDNYLPSISRVEVAGWIEAATINEVRVEAPPQKFQSKLDVVMIPCTKLNPIGTLEQALKACLAVDRDNQPQAEGAVIENCRV